MGIKNIVGDQKQFVPPEKLVFFNAEDTIGKVLDELRLRNSGLCLVKHAAGISVATVPELLHIASAQSKSDQLRRIHLREFLSKLKKLPSSGRAIGPRRTSHPALGTPAPGGVDGLGDGPAGPPRESWAPRSDSGLSGLAMEREYAEAAMVAASYWECLADPGPRCVKPDEPKRNCSCHGLGWTRH